MCNRADGELFVPLPPPLRARGLERSGATQPAVNLGDAPNVDVERPTPTAAVSVRFSIYTFTLSRPFKIQLNPSTSNILDLLILRLFFLLHFAKCSLCAVCSMFTCKYIFRVVDNSGALLIYT